MCEGMLTGHQYEIMQAVWESGSTGMTAAELWSTVRKSRKVTRTTILKMVERLEKRDWLRRVPAGENGSSTIHFVASIGKSRAALRLLRQFVDDYYDGNASDLIHHLLLFKCLSPREQERFRRRLAEQPTATENCNASVQGFTDD